MISFGGTHSSHIISKHKGCSLNVLSGGTRQPHHQQTQGLLTQCPLWWHTAATSSANTRAAHSMSSLVAHDSHIISKHKGCSLNVLSGATRQPHHQQTQGLLAQCPLWWHTAATSSANTRAAHSMSSLVAHGSHIISKHKGCSLNVLSGGTRQPHHQQTQGLLTQCPLWCHTAATSSANTRAAHSMSSLVAHGSHIISKHKGCSLNVLSDGTRQPHHQQTQGLLTQCPLWCHTAATSSANTRVAHSMSSLVAHSSHIISKHKGCSLNVLSDGTRQPHHQQTQGLLTQCPLWWHTAATSSANTRAAHSMSSLMAHDSHIISKHKGCSLNVLSGGTRQPHHQQTQGLLTQCPL